MISRPQQALIRTAVMVLIIVGGFALFHNVAQSVEAKVSASVAGFVSGGGRVSSHGNSIVVDPYHATPFRAVLTPSCSSLASVLAVLALSFLSVHYPASKRILATTTAALALAVGNVLRIALSVGAGLVAGRSTLVLFHDWVGGALTFVFTLGGFTLFLYLLLPRHDDRLAPVAVR